MNNDNTTIAAHIITTLTSKLAHETQPALNYAIDTAAITMFTTDMAVRLAQKREEGRNGWWNPHTCSVKTLARMLQDFIQRGELLDAANLAMFLYCREGGAEAVRDLHAATKQFTPHS